MARNTQKLIFFSFCFFLLMNIRERPYPTSYNRFIFYRNDTQKMKTEMARFQLLYTHFQHEWLARFNATFPNLFDAHVIWVHFWKCFWAPGKIIPSLVDKRYIAPRISSKSYLRQALQCCM